MEFIDKKEEIEIPRGSGIEGFLMTIRKVLSLPRVQFIHIENGKVVFARSVRPNEPVHPLAIDFSSLLPSHVIRNAELEELPEEINAAMAICQLTRAAAIRQLHPIAFASGAKSNFWAWHQKTTGVELGALKDTVYGLPFLRDELLPSEALFLLAGYSKGSALVDTRFVFKISMPLISEVKT